MNRLQHFGAGFVIAAFVAAASTACRFAGPASDGAATKPPTAPSSASDIESVPLPEKADRILVLKGERRMTLYRGDRELRTYRVSLGGSPVGDKKCQGDEKTPEGEYRIVGRNPNSIAHRSLMISYPNDEDRKEAAELGCDPGGDITIHGLYNKWAKAPGVTKEWLHSRDWTWGCVAVTNEEMDEIWDAVPDGTPIEIRP